jgi:adenylate cyclase
LQGARAVIAAIGRFGERSETPENEPAEMQFVPTPVGVLWPTSKLMAAAGVGLVNISTDAAGVPRFLPTIYRYENGIVPSLALAAASRALDASPTFTTDGIKLAAVVRTDLGYHIALHYYGPRGSIASISAAAVLSGELDADKLRDRLVVLGATATGIGDVYATPFDRLTPGVEIVSTGIANLLGADNLIRTQAIRRIDAAVMFFLPVLCVSFLSMRGYAFGLTLSALFVTTWLIGVFFAFAHGYWLNIALPLVATLPIAFGFTFARLGVEKLTSKTLAQQRDILSNFQSPLLRHVLASPGFLQTPVDQNVAVIFLDLVGFTSFAEQNGARRARELLASFQAMIERCIVEHNGVVIDFMGDGAMILFGLPEPRKDDADSALKAVFALEKDFAAWQEAERDDQAFLVRIGAHFGAAVVSKLGAKQHQHITATGDTVNTTSRLLEAAKLYRATIVVSEPLLDAASVESRLAATLGLRAHEIVLRGRSAPLAVRLR